MGFVVCGVFVLGLFGNWFDLFFISVLMGGMILMCFEGFEMLIVLD